MVRKLDLCQLLAVALFKYFLPKYIKAQKKKTKPKTQTIQPSINCSYTEFLTQSLAHRQCNKIQLFHCCFTSSAWVKRQTDCRRNYVLPLGHWFGSITSSSQMSSPADSCLWSDAKWICLFTAVCSGIAIYITNDFPNSFRDSAKG